MDFDMEEPPDEEMWAIAAGVEEETMTLDDVEAEYALHVAASRATGAIEEMANAEITPPDDNGPMLPHGDDMFGSSGSMAESPSRSSTTNSMGGSSPVHGGAGAIATGQATSGCGAAKDGVDGDLSRKRLRTKGPACGYYFVQARQRSLEDIAGLLCHPAYVRYRKMSGAVLCRLQTAFRVRKFRFMQRLANGDKLTIGDETLRMTGTSRRVTEQKALYEKWLRLVIKNEQLSADLLGVFVAKCLPFELAARFSACHRISKDNVFLTWNGPWGNLYHLDKIPTEDVEVEAIFPQLKAKSQALWEEFREQGRRWAFVHTAIHYAQSMELCTKTLKRTGLVKVHCHAWFCCRKTPGHTCEYIIAPEFTFKHSVPHHSPSRCSTSGRGRSAKFADAFYLTAHKIGSIFTYSTVVMFKDYSPPPSWITYMLNRNKLDVTVAETLYAKCITNAKRNIESMRYLKSFQMQQRREEQRLQVENTIRANQRPFKKIDEVNTWMKQYAEIRDRYLFLVLDGDSQFGKTRFAANLTTAEKFFLVDCSSATEPELRLFDRDQHDVVCFDEAKPSMIIRVKKLVQAGVDMARLGQSATNQVSYQVWFHRVKLVVCCNGWDEQVRKMPSEDAAWLKKNSVYVKVTEPLFE